MRFEVFFSKSNALNIKKKKKQIQMCETNANFKDRTKNKNFEV